MSQPDDTIYPLDTETTGFYHGKGDRIVEIGVTQIIGNRETDNVFHSLVNPQGKTVDPGALAVHGHTDAILKSQPTFREIAPKFLRFIGKGKIVIHNAKFDMGFINAELARLGLPPLENEIVDSLSVARKLYPDQRNTLDALCTRLDVDASGRTLHGALIDAMLLGRCWIKMTKADQLQLADTVLPTDDVVTIRAKIDMITRKYRPRHPAFLPSAAETIAHDVFVADKVKDSIWGKLRNNLLTA